MDDILFELNQFHDGTWSVAARVFAPGKKIYEHPEYINLTKEEAEEYCQTLIEHPVSLLEIQQKWVLIWE